MKAIHELSSGLTVGGFLTYQTSIVASSDRSTESNKLLNLFTITFMLITLQSALVHRGSMNTLIISSLPTANNNKPRG